MSRHSLLQDQIKEAWQQCIAEDYSRQRINSERSLQASVWSRLNTRLPEDWRMFIEPRMVVQVADADGALVTCYPDLVICDAGEVVGIIELKYQPRVLPKWQKDLDKFDLILASRDYISISNIRFRGIEKDAHIYRLAKDVLFVWAGVHKDCKICLKDNASPGWKNRFLELHAGTQHSLEPKVW